MENMTILPEVTTSLHNTSNDTCGMWEAHGRTLENNLWIYTAPLILLFSVCGNVMTILIMCHKDMRGTSTCVYLTVLAVADMTVVIVGIIPEWLEQMNILSIWELHPTVCRMELYLYYTFLDFAIWVLVAFNVDRVIAVCFPFHKRQYCSPKRAFVACCIVLMLSHLNLHVFWTRGRTFCNNGDIASNCGDLEPFVHFERSVRPWAVLALASIAPFIIILTCNIAIVCVILRSRGARESKGFKQTTIMCLSISFAFLVLVTPNIVLLIGKKYWKTPENVAYLVARAVASQFVYINHSINFLLYALTGSRFREEIIARCSSTKKAPAGPLTTSRMLSVTPSEQRASLSSSPISILSGTGIFSTQKSQTVRNGSLCEDVKL